MNHLPKGLAQALPTASLSAIGLLVGALLVASAPGAAVATPTPIAFGMDSASVAGESAAGVKPDYGTFWIGPWTLTSGWGGPDGQLDSMRNAGVTPAIHFYYWGDDISPTCVENGCWSTLHNTQKDRAHWQTLSDQLVANLNARMQGKPAVIFLESEFNKGGIETYEPFDGYLADMAARIHAGYPAARIVLGFGNWGSVYWGNFDRAAAASDMVGIQGLRGSTRQSATDMMTLYDGLLAGVKTLEATFPGKPIMLTDIAVSSYPEPGYLAVQRDVLKEVFDNLGVLKSHGVQAMVYRSWLDSPTMDTANYYGMAERYWGLANKTSLKPSAQVWIDGVKAERAGSTPALTTTTTTTRPPTTTTTTTTAAPYSASFATNPASNEWWVQEKVSSSPAPAKVDLQVNGGAWQALKHESYGDWTLSTHVVKGSSVVFRATTSDGHTAKSPAQPWLGAATATTTAFKATFSPKAVGNDWWVETAVSANAPVAKVEAKVGSGSWTVLAKQDWGTYAKSIHAPNGSLVTFRATSSTGATATSAATTWT
jgi:hypothetical protein